MLAYLETQHTLYEEANDPKRFDPVYEHAAKVRAWLSSTEPGVRTVTENADGTATRVPPETTGL